MFSEALHPEYAVRQSPVLNPPLWELGHIAWFQDWWISRNSELNRGHSANPHAIRERSRLDDADDLYNSSITPHPSRWALPHLDVDRTKEYLSQSLADALTHLGTAGESDDELYFFRLCLAHEDMHGEAFAMMARTLEFGKSPRLTQNAPTERLTIPAWTRDIDTVRRGFCFDNELGQLQTHVPSFEISSNPVTQRDFAAFRGMINRHSPGIKHAEGSDESASHVNLAQARAYCKWIGGRLPSEHEWASAQRYAGDAFHWGSVWEWTASVFEPFPGFRPDPYLDYSAPWFGTHQVLKGASVWTCDRMRHPDYRNFYTPDRTDVLSGFRVAWDITS